MITIKLQGGLGNQMFQYALARRFEIDSGARVILDSSYFEESNAWPFELPRLRTKQFPTIKVPIGRWPYLMGRFGIRYGRTLYYAERDQGFQSKVFAAKQPLFLSGYWQSEKYFASIRGVLLEEFECSDPMIGEAAEIRERIRQRPSVSLHVRRGDYLSNPAALAVHGLLGVDYYRKALSLIEDQCGSMPQVFVFSDDPDWCRSNLPLNDRAVFVSGRNFGALTEQRLMAHCQNQIIANSTFSWWAGWLNRHPGKIVVAPKAWFADGKRSCRDLIPQDWVRVG